MTNKKLNLLNVQLRVIRNDFNVKNKGFFP